MHRTADESVFPGFDAAADPAASAAFEEVYHPFFVLSILQLLRANLLALLHSSTFGPVAEALCQRSESSRESSSYDGTDVERGVEAADTQLNGSGPVHWSSESSKKAPQETRRNHRVRRRNVLGPTTSLDYEKEQRRVLFNLPPMGRNSGSSGDAKAGRFSAVLGLLQRQLLALVVDPKHSCKAATDIQAAAAELLIQGVEVFYPSATEQARLLRDLLEPPEGAPLSPPRASKVDAQETVLRGWESARHFLLCPLLRRLATDSLASKLVPRFTPASYKTLELTSLLKLLLRHLVTEKDAAPGRRDEARTPEALGLLTELVLTLQKHLMSWAGSNPNGAPTGRMVASAQVPEVAISLGGFDQGASPLVEAALLAKGGVNLADSWSSLLNYAEMVVNMGLGLLGDNPDGASPDFASTLVGTVLPSLITVLLPFASHPVVATRLLGPTTRLAQLLDAMVLRTGDVLAVDAAYVAFRLGEAPPERPDASAALSGDGAAPRLPWVLSLLKATASLAATMAGTLVEAPAAEPLGDSLRLWLKSPLLTRGLTQPNRELLALNGIGPSAAKQSPPSTQSSSGGAALVESLATHGREASPLIQWLRGGYGKLDGGYLMVTRQALRVEPSALNLAESVLFGALLHHSGLAPRAALAARALSRAAAPQPPRCLLALWRVVSEATIWLWRRRSQLRSQGHAEVDVFAAGAAAAALLLVFEAQPLASLLHVPSAPLILEGSPASSSTVGLEATRRARVRRRWRAAMGAVRAGLRWRAAYGPALEAPRGLARVLAVVGEEDRRVWHLARDLAEALVEHELQAETRAGAEVRTGSAPAPLSTKPLPTERLVAAACENAGRAWSRAAGLRAFKRLASSLQTRSVALDVLSQLAPALGAASAESPGRHYLSGLEAAGPAAEAAVRTELLSLFGDLLAGLEGCLPEMGGSVTGSTGSAVGPRAVDTHHFLLLCEAWGLAFNDADWPFLASVSVLRTAHALSQRLEASLAALAADPAAASARAASVSPDRAGKRRAPTGGAGAASAAAPKSREARVCQCLAAGRALSRLLTARLASLGMRHQATSLGGSAPGRTAAAAWAAVLSPTFEVLALDLRRCLLMMRPKQGEAGAEAAPGPGSAAAERDSTRPSHRRRCQELIIAPRRFMNMEDGLAVPAEQLLANSKGPDFSITLWLFLTQDSTGRPRAVLTRGQGLERWPVVLLREADRRLEVAFGSTNMDTLAERLTSKDPVPVPPRPLPCCFAPTAACFSNSCMLLEAETLTRSPARVRVSFRAFYSRSASCTNGRTWASSTRPASCGSTSTAPSTRRGTTWRRGTKATSSTPSTWARCPRAT